MVFKIMVLAIMLIASVCDIRKKEISLLFITICGALSLLRIASEFYRGQTQPLDVLISLIPGAVMLVLSLLTRQQVGLGDGLLLIFAGPALGGDTAIFGICAALFGSSIFSAVILAFRLADRKTRIPFVPFMTLGMGVMMLAKV